MNETGTTTRSSRGLALFAAALVTLLALIPRVAQLDHNPFVDEFNHVLAARGLLDDGTLRVNGGDPYERAWLFTGMVASALALGPDTLVTARVPALVAGVAMVVLLFVWVRRRAGPGAAWLAAGLLALSPDAIFMSQLARFYTWQVLCLLVVAVATMAAVEPGESRRRRLAAAVAAIVAAPLALHFQILSAVGLAGLAAWVAIDRGPSAWRALIGHRWRVAIVAGAVVAVVAAVAVVVSSGILRTVWDMFNFVALTAESQRDNVRFYHWWWLDRYPTLWTLAPVAALIAYLRRRRLALLCLCVFGVGFVFHSFAAWKNPRYIFWTLPFFFALWGVAGSVLLDRLGAAAEAAVAPWRPRPWLRRLTAAAAVGAVLGFAAIGNPAFSLAARMVLVSDDDWGDEKSMRGEPGWKQAAPRLREWADESSVVISSSGMKSLYYVGRLDAMLNANAFHANQAEDAGEFALSGKLMRPIISAPASLERLHECYRSGLVIVERNHLGKSWAVTEASAAWLAARADHMDTPDHWRLEAFRWTDGGGGGDCRFGDRLPPPDGPADSTSRRD